MKTLYDMTPKAYKNFFKTQIMYAGFKESESNSIVGNSYFLAVIMALTTFTITFAVGFMPIGIFVSLSVSLGVVIFTYLIFMLIADSRANQIENVLPDALQLMSANVRAGMTIDRAIWLAARPEFGVLEEEIKTVGAKTMGGKSLKVALSEMTNTIKSKLLDRTIKLLLEGIDSGGELAHLLEEIAANIRITQTLKKEIKSSVMTYSIFILFASVIAAPFLFSISIFFVETMSKMWGSAGLGAGVTGSTMGMGGMFSKAKGPQITADDLFWFSIAALIITGFFGSMTIALIQSGKEKNGLRLVPMMIGTSIAILIIGGIVIRSLFGTLLH